MKHHSAKQSAKPYSSSLRDKKILRRTGEFHRMSPNCFPDGNFDTGTGTVQYYTVVR